MATISISFQNKVLQAQDFNQTSLEALRIRLVNGSDLQPIEEPVNWWSPFVTVFIILIMSGGGATKNAYVHNEGFIVFVNWTVDGEFNVFV